MLSKIELYFLNFKFIIYANDKLINKINLFWKGFLEYDSRFKTEFIWTINFKNSNCPRTDIDYGKHIICHFHNSICDLTEFNNLFRETIVKLSAMKGILWLHCSAFKCNEKTYLVIGEKGSGKTTLLINALKNLNAKFIGNDQLPIFIYKNQVCCYSWRPDIKICSEKGKTLHLINNMVPYNFIDIDKMSKRLKKNIQMPNSDLTISICHDKLNVITEILILKSIPNIIKLEEKIYNYIINDPETIVPFKLENISLYMPYWNKRITKIKLDKYAENMCNNIINELSNTTLKYLVGNRLKFEDVSKMLLERADTNI